METQAISYYDLIMNMNIVQIELEKLANDIEGESLVIADEKNPCRRIAPYKFLPLLKKYPILEKEFSRRINVFSSLSESDDFHHLIDDIHSQMCVLKKMINRNKLPIDNRYDHPRRKRILQNNEQELPSVTFKEIWTFLDDNNSWCKLGDGDNLIISLNDSRITPFRHIHRQYYVVLTLALAAIGCLGR